MPDWINNPRYQRIIQKLQGMPQSQRAIFTSAGADRQFASEEMRGKINAINAATARKGREQSVSTGKERLSMAQDRFKSSTKLRDRKWDIDKGDRQTAETIGYGGIALSGLLGFKEMELANLQAAQERADRKKILGYMGRGLKT